jgi:transposase
MYLRTVRVKTKNGKPQEYIRLVEAYWEGGRSKQRVVMSLGRKDLLAPHLDSLIRIIRGEQPATALSLEMDKIQANEAACWGTMLVARELWKELGLDSLLDSCESKHRRSDKAPLSDRALVLVANRLAEPGSEHALADWLETDFACDRKGERFLPEFKQQRRVRVDLNWLQRWYRTLDELIAYKEKIEEDLFLQLRKLYSLEAEMVFYDITSTYFEGGGPGEFAKYGYSRDQKRQNRQVLVGQVMVDGWPIAHHVFQGNLLDHQTVVDVVKDLEKRFGLKRVIFVGDHGMITTANVDEIKKRGHGYLLGLKRRRQEETYKLIERATGDWTECPAGIAAVESGNPPKTKVQEVRSDTEGVRVFVAHSQEREAYERGMRERSMERTRAELEKLAQAVKSGRLKSPEKIGERVGRVLNRNHGHRFYGWELAEGEFKYFEHPVHLTREKALEGKYVIQTEEKDLSPVEAVQEYKELSEVERGFRILKDVIDMRPIYHRIKKRVQAHIFVAALACLIHRLLEKKLKSAKLSMSADQALKALRTIHIVDVLVADQHKQSTTLGSKAAQQVISALEIKDLSPQPCASASKTLA